MKVAYIGPLSVVELGEYPGLWYKGVPRNVKDQLGRVLIRSPKFVQIFDAVVETIPEWEDPVAEDSPKLAWNFPVPDLEDLEIDIEVEDDEVPLEDEVELPVDDNDDDE